jgi:predicted dehydrogenase
VKIAIVGCGNIAEHYANRIVAAEGLTLVGVTDSVPERAEALARALDVTQFPSVDELLGDEAVDIVVNLTIPSAHASVTAAALEAGKHVHTEKPVALRYDEARELVELARRTGRRLSCSPATLLGEAQQTAWKLVRDGALGQVRVVYAEANWGRIESWHPTPQALYAVGPLVDVGVYPLTILTAMFGPVRRVVAYGATLEPDRTTLGGEPFLLTAPDFIVSLLEFDGGVVGRLTTTFWVRHGRQRGIEFHGADGRSLHLASFQEFDSALDMSSDAGDTYVHVPLVREPFPGTDWARPIADLAEAIAEDRPHRASAEQAAHVVDVVEAIARSQAENGAVDVRSDFEPPRPMEWASS